MSQSNLEECRPRVKKVIVLGGGYAGLLAIGRLLQRSEQFEITLVEPKEEFIQRIRLHEALAGKSIKSLSYKQLFSRKNVNWIQAKASQWLPEKRLIETIDDKKQTTQLDYDYLIYALGSHVTLPVDLMAGNTTRLTLLNRAQDSQAFSQRMQNAVQSPRVLVCGAGLTGIESACEIAEAFPSARLELVAESYSFEAFSKGGKQQLFSRFKALGIVCRIPVGEVPSEGQGVAIVSIRGKEVKFSDGTLDSYDEIIWCGGFKAAGLAVNSGVSVDQNNRVIVNQQLQLPDHPEVFVAGDSARVEQVDGQSLRMGCAVAMPHGIYVGEAIKKLEAQRPLNPFRFAFFFRCISLGRTDALIQFTHYDDSPKQSVWTKRRAVWTKELICRMTLAMVRWELRSGLSLYRWPEPSKRQVSLKQTGENSMDTKESVVT